ncbi:MAG: shikimate dehydrogenase [Candidatus Omnitrophota bacterium]
MANESESKKKYGLLGREISYSLSPVMHNAAFRHFDIPAEYKLFDVENKDLDSFLERVMVGEISGFNVTVPYKVAIYDAFKTRKNCALDDTAERLGAVNTVKPEDSGLKGYNTDGSGFYESLKEDAGFDLKGKNVFIFGTGGSGRAICIYLAFLGEDGPENIHLYDVAELRLLELESECNAKTGRDICKNVKRADIGETMARCDLVVNATPLGTKERDPLPFSGDYLYDGMTVFDLVYCRQTELVRQAKEKGLKAVNGEGMLISQAAYAFNLWTSRDLKETKRIMKEAFFEKRKETSV